MIERLKRVRSLTVVIILLFGSVGMSNANDRGASAAAVTTITVRITPMGFEPASITVKRGVPARIKFIRTTDKTCATEVVFPDFGIKRDLPLNQWVAVTFTPPRSGEFVFTCGMNMQRGRLVVHG